jgi:acyl-CoA dehydrogenase
MIRDREAIDAFLEQIRRFVREELVPREAEISDTDRIPDDILAGMRALGLFGMSIPETYDGLGMTMEEEVLAAFELGRTSPAFRSTIGTNNGIGSQGLVMDGTEAQRRRYLPRLASGDLISAFALTEPDSGSDAASLRSTARRVEGGWVIDGAKRYITNAPAAGLFTVFARTDPDRKGAAGVSAFLVEAGTPGLRVGAPDRKMGQRGALTSDVVFEGCRVGDEALLGGVPGMGFRTAMKVLDRGRLHISAVCVGVAERLIADALRYALERRQFGQPIAEFQLVQAMLADSRAEALAGRAMVVETARRKDLGEDVATDASCCKLFCAEMVGRVADRAVQVHGGAGYMQDYAVERFYRDVRLFRIYEGTTQIQQLVIARNMIREAKATG